MMSKKRGHWLALLLLFSLVAGAAADEGVPTLPHEFWGAVTIDGSAAPAGTTIVAVIGGESCGFLTTTSSGAYGGTRYAGTNLVVSGTEDQAGETITFLVDGREAGQTAAFTPDSTTTLDPSVGSAVTPTPTTTSSGGSSSGGSNGDVSSSVSSQTAVTTVATVTPKAYAGTASLGASETGEVLASVTVRTADGSGSVTVPAGTTALDGSGDPLDDVSIDTLDLTALPPVPTGNTLGLALTCGPDGATFDPAVTLTFTLTEDEWAEIDDPTTLKVLWYDDATGSWQEVPAVVDAATRTITASVSHFSVYALAWSTAAPVATTSGAEAVVTIAQIAPATAGTMPSENSISGVILVIAGLLVLGLIGGGGYLALKKK